MYQIVFGFALAAMFFVAGMMILVNLPECAVTVTAPVYSQAGCDRRVGAWRALLGATFAVTLFTGCYLTPGPGGVGVSIVPALPVVVELQDDPFFNQGVYYYYYQDDRWSYASHKSGPWVELPRDRYPREVRYSARYRHAVAAPDRPEERGRDANPGRANDRKRGEERGHGGDKHDESHDPN